MPEPFGPELMVEETAEKSTFEEAEVRGPQRRIRFLSITGGLLALLVAFLLLNFFGVLPIAGSLKQLSRLIIPRAKILTTSNLPGYRLKLVDSNLLEGYLKEWGFWQGIRVLRDEVRPQQLVIALAEGPGPSLRLSYVDAPGVIAQATDESFDAENNSYTVKPYLNRDYLPGGEKDQDDGSLRLNLLTLKHLFFTTHPAREFPSFEEADAAWKVVAQEFLAKKKMFLEVNKL